MSRTAIFFAELLALLGLTDDPRFADQYAPTAQASMMDALTEIFLTATQQEWCDILEGSDACFAPVVSLADASDHAHNRARGSFVTVGGIEMPTPAPRFSRTQPDTPTTGDAGEISLDEILEHWGEQRMTALSFADAMQLFVVGLSQGCLYSLIAIGLVLVYKATEQVNFAQGEFMMLGAFVGYQFIVLMGMPYWLGAMLTLVFMGAFGYGVEALVVRRLTGQPVFTVFILTLALGIALRAVAGIIWGFGNYSLPAPVDGNLTLGQ